MIRKITDVRSKPRRPLAIIGTGPSHDFYDWPYELVGKDVFALNGAICAHATHPSGLFWVPTEASLVHSQRRKRNPYRAALASWSPWRVIAPIDPCFPANSYVWTYNHEEILQLSTVGLTSLCVALHVAFLWGYRRIYLYGIDFRTRLVNPDGLRTRDRQAYHATSLAWLPRPQNKLRHLEAGMRNYVGAWMDYVRVGKFSLWPDCPFERMT